MTSVDSEDPQAQAGRAHTSHKSLIDAFLIAYAAGALSWVDAWRRRAHTPAG